MNHTIHKTIIAISAVSSLLFIPALSAKTVKDPEKILSSVSQESATAMQGVRMARFALFDGRPDAAEKLLDKAMQNFEKVKKEAPKQIVTVESTRKVGDKTVSTDKHTETSDLIPIEASLALGEDFVATPEKSAKLDEANRQMHAGKMSKAIEVLRAADISVSVSRLLMPLDDTMIHVSKARALIKEHEYYEANLALKGAEDGMIINSAYVVEPVQKAPKAKS